MFQVKWKPKNKVLVKECSTEEEAENFKKNCRLLNIKVVGLEDKGEINNTKIEWPRI